MLRSALPASKEWVRRAIDAIFPPRCFLCAEMIAQTGHVCIECWQELRFITAPQCQQCGHPFEYEIGDMALCGACIQDEPSYNTARAALCYDDASRKLITRFKFGDMLHPASSLAGWMVRAGKSCLEASDAVVPVPLHRTRLIKRRYNQAAILAKEVAKQADIPLLVDGLVRLRRTSPQSGLTRRQRHSNVKGAFEVHAKRLHAIEKKRILLIDDVMTTGATLEACAQALKKAGASEVHVLTVARTLLEA